MFNLVHVHVYTLLVAHSSSHELWKSGLMENHQKINASFVMYVHVRTYIHVHVHHFLSL